MSAFARRYLRNQCLFLFLQVLRCFSSLGSLPTTMNSSQDDWKLLQPSFLIQKSPDQRLFASFPELIAGYHVFHRLSMPRHPPYTLSSLTTFIDHQHELSHFLLSLAPQGITPSAQPAGHAGVAANVMQTVDHDQ